MREIIVLLANVELGPFSEVQIRHFIDDKLLFLSDLGKEQDDKEWLPLWAVLAKYFGHRVDSPSPLLSGPKTARGGTTPLPPAKVRKQTTTNLPTYKRVTPKAVSPDSTAKCA